jgi:hypothetical protein
MDSDWKRVKHGFKPDAGPLKFADAAKATRADVEALWKLSLRTGVSPFNGRPLHPDRHQAEQDNPFTLLDDEHGDRPRHSVTSHVSLIDTLCALFASRIWAEAVRVLSKRKLPNRLVFHFPIEVKGKTVEIVRTEVVQSGSASAATVVLDIDRNGVLYVMTNYTQVDLPPDAGATAGANPAFQVGDDPTVLFVLRGTEAKPEIIGGTTIKKGDYTAHRDQRTATHNKDG